MVGPAHTLPRSEKVKLSEDVKLSDDCRLKVSFPWQLLPKGDAFPEQPRQVEMSEVGHTKDAANNLNYAHGHKVWPRNAIAPCAPTWFLLN